MNRNFIFKRGRSVTSVMGGGGVYREQGKPRHMIRMCVCVCGGGGKSGHIIIILCLSNVDCAS